MNSRPNRVHLVLDFDGTITTTDTTAVIGSKCLAKARDMAGPGLSEADLPKSMQYYTEQHLRELQQWKDSSFSLHSGTSVNEEVSYLSQSKHVEQNSFTRVRDAVLKTPGDIRELERCEKTRNDFMMMVGRQAIRTGEVQVRDQAALKRLVLRVDRWGIVSVSWSRMFILGVLLEVGLVPEGQEEVFVDRIKCNELLAPLIYDRTQKTITISSALDKRDVFRRLLSEWASSASENAERSPASNAETHKSITIYAGDSVTDLGCLADAGVGTYMTENRGDNDKVIRTLKDLNFDCLDLSTHVPNVSSQRLDHAVRESKTMSSQRPTIYLVCGFQAIDDSLSRLGYPT